MPIVAGGTAFMYNLKAFMYNLKAFMYNLKADNPGLALPTRTIMPVVYSHGCGPTAVFTYAAVTHDVSRLVFTAGACPLEVSNRARMPLYP
jgi:hypothetical protein